MEVINKTYVTTFVTVRALGETIQWCRDNGVSVKSWSEAISAFLVAHTPGVMTDEKAIEEMERVKVGGRERVVRGKKRSKTVVTPGMALVSKDAGARRWIGVVQESMRARGEVVPSEPVVPLEQVVEDGNWLLEEMKRIEASPNFRPVRREDDGEDADEREEISLEEWREKVSRIKEKGATGNALAVALQNLKRVYRIRKEGEA